MLVGVLQWCRVRRRYIAYITIIINVYTEMCARFGIPIAMIGGMVKEDCNDPHDEGTFCWSENTQALVLGAYFYGYSAQCITTFVANRFTGLLATYRVWLIAAAVIQFSYPTIAAVSTTFLIISQVVRGVLAGIMVSLSYDYLNRFCVTSNENKMVISLYGVAASIGAGTGGLIAGLIMKTVGWQYYFYYAGSAYTTGLILALLFIQESPEKSWYLTAEEKSMIVKANTTDPKSSISPPENINNRPTPVSLKSIFCRLYLLAFSMYFMAYNLVFYNILNVVPFYLNKIMGADALFISYLNISLCILIAFCTLAFSFIFQRLDKLLTWLECRMIFTVVPMVLQIIFSIGLSFNTSITGGTIILTLCAIACSTFFSGSVIHLNFELDPENSPVILSIINSCGQMSGFIGPILMATITYTDPNTPDYESVHRQRWSHFFYVVAGFAAVGALAIVLSYIVKPDEWVNRDKKLEYGKE